MSEETPYEVARRLHAQGASEEELERALRGLGLDEVEARVVSLAGRGEAGVVAPAPGLALAEHPPAAAPTHPCPVHAAWPVAATCTRCGKFFCHQCVRDAGLRWLPESRQCPECERTHPTADKLAGIGGWLVLPALHIGLSPVWLVVNLVTELSQPIDAAFTAPIVMESAFTVLSLGYVVATAVNFFQRKRRAIHLMLGFYALGLVTAFVNLAVVSWVASIAGREAPRDTAEQFGRGLGALLVWGSYFLRSERVKKTFTR